MQNVHGILETRIIASEAARMISEQTEAATELTERL